MANELIVSLWEGLLASSAGCVLVLLLRRPWARAFGAGSTPLLWTLVPLCLLAVWLPAPSVAVDAGWGLLPAAMLEPLVIVPAAAAVESSRFDLAMLLAPWALGSTFAALYFVLQQRRFRHQLGRLTAQGDGVLLAERNDVGPAVLGVLRPRIVLPADFHTRYSTDEQALILAHERSHQRRGDVLANAIATGLRALYWFNPLLHYAANRLRHDHELASDADVVQRYPHARRRYADTLLNVQLAVPGLPVGCLWQSSHPLKERILMLSTYRSTPRRRTLGTALAAGLSLSAAAVAWASQPPRVSGELPLATEHAAPLQGATMSPRQSIERGAAEAGATISDVERRDRLRPRTDITLKVDDMQGALTTDRSLPEGAMQVASRDDIARLSATETIAAVADKPAEQGPTYRSLAPPRYPPHSVRERETGLTLLRVEIDTAGAAKAITVHASSGSALLDESAIAAVKLWKFNPAKRNGEPVEASALVPVCFQMDEAAATSEKCTAPAEALDSIYRIPPTLQPNG